MPAITKGLYCPTCLGSGWVCEKHPPFPWPHESPEESDGRCPGPGMPWPEPDCPFRTVPLDSLT
jgi:hypothetical protein